jgi:D-3-phosphoglycerate dehydrogenase
MLGALAKQLCIRDRATREGGWEIRNSYSSVDLDGKTMGLIGLGRIGSLVARRVSSAFGMKVIAFDPYITPERAAELDVTLVRDMDDIFRRADVVSLHTPLTPETRGLVNVTRLRLMKPSAFLLNLSRGEVVEEKALYEALKTGKIAGAGLDVYDPEPPVAGNPLFGLDNVIFSPHCATLTQECVIRMATGAAEGVVDVLSGKIPQFVVNPEVFKK